MVGALVEMTAWLEDGCSGVEGAMSAVGTEWEQVWVSGYVVVLGTGFVTGVRAGVEAAEGR